VRRGVKQGELGGQPRIVKSQIGETERSSKFVASVFLMSNQNCQPLFEGERDGFGWGRT